MIVPLERIRAILHAEDPDAWYRLGVAYGNADEWSKAITALKNALRLNACHDDSLEALGKAYLLLGDAESAAKYYYDAARLDIWHRNPQRWNNLGIAYGKLGRLDDEVKAYRKALEYDPKNVAVWRNLTTVFYNANRFSDLVAVCEEAVRHIPQDARVWYDFGFALEKLALEKSDLERAAWACAEAWRLRPDFPGPWMDLMRVRVKLGRFDEAGAVCREVAQHRPNDHGYALSQLCEHYIWAGRYEAAEDILTSLSKVAPDYVTNLRELLNGQIAKQKVSISPKGLD